MSFAQQFGFGSSSNLNSTLTSAQMVPEILRSRRLATELLHHKFISPKNQDSLHLASILLGSDPILMDTINIGTKSLLVNRILKSIIKIRTDASSSVIQVQATFFDKNIAKELVDAVINICKKIL